MLASSPMSSAHARKSQWLRSALCHHYNPDPFVENEILVLATGIDQYLQEIFHHLAFHNSEDIVSGEDFRTLCTILGISKARRNHHIQKEGEEGIDILAHLPCELNFREFHGRLCGHFSLKAREGKSTFRLPVTEETEHIEREIRVRWPRVRRRKCVSFDLSKEQSQPAKRTQGNSTHSQKRVSADWSGQTANGLSPKGILQEQQRAENASLSAENASLRELVEDLRSALQASDARCMALEVALHRAAAEWEGQRPTATTTPKTTSTTMTTTPPPPPSGQGERSSSIRSWRKALDLQRELELIRSSRDGQLQEAMRYSRQLEEELTSAHRRTGLLEEVSGRLRKERAHMRSKMEEAREALAAGLKRVEELQSQASQVAPLQQHVRQLQLELDHVRSICACREAGSSEAEGDYEREKRPAEEEEESWLSTAHLCPGGEDSSVRGGEECMQRAVEGRAASDEEEEERGEEEGQCCLLEAKRLSQRLQHCTRGCQSAAVRHIFSSHGLQHGEWEGCAGVGRPSGVAAANHHSRDWKRARELEKELELRHQEVSMLQAELQQLETERVRLSLLEERFTDALTLLMQLRSKRVSRRMLGKILMSSLDVFSQKDQGPYAVVQVVDTLCHLLVSSDLLLSAGEGSSGGEGGGQVPYNKVTSSSPGSTNSLLISC